MIYSTKVDNVIALTINTECDLTRYETSLAHQGCKSGTNLVRRIMNKSGVSKGGQTVIVSETNRIRPYWYQHHYNMNTRYNEVGIMAEGPVEV